MNLLFTNMFGFVLQLSVFLFLLLLVSLGAGAYPDIKHLPSNHNSLASLQGEDHLEWSSVDAANI